jgi:hypothetical protein
VPRLVGVLILCAALVACGKSAEEQYEEGFPPINRGLAALGKDVGEGVRSAGDATLAGKFADYARRLAALRGRLDELEPPDRLANDHSQLLAAIGAVRGELTDVADAARRGDAAAARDAATRLVRDSARLDDARSAVVRDLRR